MTSSSTRPIDRVLRRLRERQREIALIERDLMKTISTDAVAALRLALAASELRTELVRELAL